MCSATVHCSVGGQSRLVLSRRLSLLPDADAVGENDRDTPDTDCGGRETRNQLRFRQLVL